MQRARAIYDCTADGDGELSFKEGDILINVTESAEDGWYVGRLEGSLTEGLFPYNYVEFITGPTLPPNHNSKPQRSDTSQKQQHDNVCPSPPRSSLTSTWCIISANETQEANEPPVKAADAFEKAMSVKPGVVRTQTLVSGTTPAAVVEKPPVPAPKPSQFKHAAESTSAAPRVKAKPAGLLQQEPQPTPPHTQAPALGSGPFPIIRHKPTTGHHHVPTKKANLVSSVFEEDGFQIVPLPPLSQRRAELKPVGSSPSKPPAAVAHDRNGNNNDNGIFSALQQPSNPAPRLPSRPTVNKRRPKPTKSTAMATARTGLTTESPTTTVTSSLPEIKQKPILELATTASSSSSSFQKARSASNPIPPPLQPKPSLSKSMSTSNSNSGSAAITGSKRQQHDIRRHGSMPSATTTTTIAIALPGLASSLPGGRPPKALYSSGFSASSASHFIQKSASVATCESSPSLSSSSSAVAIPLPGLVASDHTRHASFKPVRSATTTRYTDPLSPSSSESPIHVSVASRREQWQQKSIGSPTSNRTQSYTMTSPGWSSSSQTACTTDPSLKKPSFPHASDGAAQVISRYEDLFNKIQDGGVVDARTAKLIWERSRVSDDALAKIWKQCDPDGSGKLNKAGFIRGLREIDALLAQNDEVVSSARDAWD